MNLKLKKPCGNCPFLKVGAIPLHKGRIESICADLYKNDRHIFLCHKTAHGGAKETSACMGALAWGWKDGRLPVAARFAVAVGLLKTEVLEKLAPKIIDLKPQITRRKNERRRESRSRVP